MRVRVGVRTGVLPVEEKLSHTSDTWHTWAFSEQTAWQAASEQGAACPVGERGWRVCVGAWACAWRVSVAQRAYVHVRIRTPTASKRRLLNEKQPCASQPSGVKTIIAGRLLSVGKASRERLEHEFDSLCIGQPSQFTASKRRGLACRADAAICHEFFEVSKIR